MREFQIGNRLITDETPCYVIGEIGHNHQGNLQTATQLIKSCAVSGADAVKLQKRDNETLYTREMLQAPYEHEHSFGSTYGAHRKALEFGMREYVACRTVAHAAGLQFFATAFDEPSADFLMELGVPAIKIASGGATDHVLLRHVAGLRVPLIVSTGGMSWEDVDDTVDLLTGFGASFALLHCTAAYPVCHMQELNLRAIAEMRARYPQLVVGWSGHDPGVSMSLIAYGYGARIIEKHVTLNRAMKGTDHAFSLEPKGLATLCEDLKKAHVANGDGVKRLYESERKPLAKMRRQHTLSGMKVTGHLEAYH